VGAAKIYEGCWLRAAERGASTTRAATDGEAVGVERVRRVASGKVHNARSAGWIAVGAAKDGR